MINLSQLNDLGLSGELLVDFGLQPVSNRFLPVDSQDEAPHFPLKLNLCLQSGLIHLSRPFPIDEVKPVYDWLTCYEPEDHLDDLVKKLTSLPNIDKSANIGSYSFKDDTTLRRLRELGYENTWRIDPEQDLDITDRCANVETYQSVLSQEKADRIKARYGAADIFVVRHVIEHAYDLPGFIQFVQSLVKPDGYIVWELPDCENALAVGDCTTIWEEHVFYFTSCTFLQLLRASDFEIVHYESVPYVLENSLVAIVRNAPFGSDRATIEDDAEKIAGEIARARRFADKMADRRASVRMKLEQCRNENRTVALFGAGHLSVAFVSLMGVADLVHFVIDDNENKKGMKMPVGDLEIIGSAALYTSGVDVCLLGLNPQNQPKVIGRHSKFVEQGGSFVSIFPGSDSDIETSL